jgi:hypothetical protein
MMKVSLETISHDLQLAIVAFQRAEQLSSEQQRVFPRSIAERTDLHLIFDEYSVPVRDAQLTQKQERECCLVENGIYEIFCGHREPSTLVLQQGTHLDARSPARGLT